MNAKSLIDQNGKTIQIGSVVRHGALWNRVSAISVAKQTVNLTALYTSHSYGKGVPLAEVYEDGDAQWASFSKSETYQSM